MKDLEDGGRSRFVMFVERVNEGARDGEKKDEDLKVSVKTF